MLTETKHLTIQAIEYCLLNFIPVKILTKCTEWIYDFPFDRFNGCEKDISFGFTLTGHDDLEPNAGTNYARIKAMKKLHDAGFKTWASLEPIIDFESTIEMVIGTRGFCDLYKIGLESGKKYNSTRVLVFYKDVMHLLLHDKAKIYWKDSILKHIGIERRYLPSNCVNRDFNI